MREVWTEAHHYVKIQMVEIGKLETDYLNYIMTILLCYLF